MADGGIWGWVTLGDEPPKPPEKVSVEHRLDERPWLKPIYLTKSGQLQPSRKDCKIRKTKGKPGNDLPGRRNEHEETQEGREKPEHKPADQAHDQNSTPGNGLTDSRAPDDRRMQGVLDPDGKRETQIWTIAKLEESQGMNKMTPECRVSRSQAGNFIHDRRRHGRRRWRAGLPGS